MQQEQFSGTGKFPMRVYQLAAEYRLGNVEKRYSQRLTRLASIGGGCALLLFTCMLIVFYVVNDFGNGSFSSEPSKFMSTFFGFVLFIVFGGGLIIYGLLSDRVAYECSEGFMILRDRGRRVELALTWDQLTEAWRVTRSRQLPLYYISYQSEDRETRSYRVFSRRLWRRCYAELQRRLSSSQSEGEGKGRLWR